MEERERGERQQEPAQHALVYVKIVFDRPWGLGSEIETPPSKTTIFRASLRLILSFSISDNLRNANLIRCALTPSPLHSPSLALSLCVSLSACLVCPTVGRLSGCACRLSVDTHATFTTALTVRQTDGLSLPVSRFAALHSHQYIHFVSWSALVCCQRHRERTDSQKRQQIVEHTHQVVAI